MGNPIFNMFNGQGQQPMQGNVMNNNFGNINDFANMLNQRFGSMQNCLGVLSGLMGKRGMNLRDTVIQAVKGKTFTPQLIAEFKEFASKNGGSQEDIKMVLSTLGLE